MKKIYLAAIAVLSLIPFVSNAQWTGAPGDIYYNTGNVGVGTTSPGGRFEIAGLSGSPDASIILNPFGAGYVSKIISYASGSGQTLSLIHNNVNALSVDHSGKVGIGTISPNSILTVRDETNGGTFSVGSLANKDATIGLTPYGTGLGNDYWKLIANNSGQNYRFDVASGGSTYMSIVSNAVSGAGNVGIGTTTPDEKLSVLGKIHANEVKVDMSVPGPDYVFKPDYKLPSLAEVKTYVEKNHHLSEIPSADEMAKNGLNLGEMNTMLLKKVEELTLYMIKVNKQLQGQKNESDRRNRQQQHQINELRHQLSTYIKKH